MKLKTADNLAPIWEQMVDLVEPSSKVIEFGCATGDLLLKLSPKIKWGVGIDRLEPLITEANAKKEKIGISNVAFVSGELPGNYRFLERYDVAIASLFFHVVPRHDAIFLLDKMREISDCAIIAAFSRPKTLSQKILLQVDQRLTRHYAHFKTYQKQGYFEGLLRTVPCPLHATYDTNVPFVKIYQIGCAQQLLVFKGD